MQNIAHGFRFRLGRRWFASILLAALAVLLLSSCKNGEQGSQGDEAGAAAPLDKETGKAALAGGMGAHFVQATKIRDAVVSGDLAAAKAAAEALQQQLAQQEFPSQWANHVKAINGSIGEILKTDNPRVVGSAISAIAYTCGSCHIEVQAKPVFADVADPGLGADTKQHMLRHQWAADRMWEGLVVPSDELWRRGAQALGESPLHPQDFAQLQGRAKQLKLLGERIHELGNTALTTDNMLRPRVYSTFLGSCSGCHMITSGGPKTPVRPSTVEQPGPE